MKLDYHQGTPGTYAGLDRFGRVKDQRWYDYGASADAVRIKHGVRSAKRICFSIH